MFLSVFTFIPTRYVTQRNKYNREKDKFKELINKYSTSTLQKDISILIEQKCNELLTIENKKKNKCSTISEQQNNNEKEQLYSSDIIYGCFNDEVEEKRICLSCRSDISDRKKGTKFCSKKCKNDYTNPILNPRNNLLKSIEKINSNEKLFDDKEYFNLTAFQLELLTKQNSIYNTINAAANFI